MTDKEILEEVYRTCKREPDVGSGEIINMIEREWQREDGLKFWMPHNKNRGLEISEDGTVTNLK